MRTIMTSYLHDYGKQKNRPFSRLQGHQVYVGHHGMREHMHIKNSFQLAK